MADGGQTHSLAPPLQQFHPGGPLDGGDLAGDGRLRIAEAGTARGSTRSAPNSPAPARGCGASCSRWRTRTCAEELAAALTERHGGIDVVFNNAVMRVAPDDDPRAIVGPYAEVNNFATTRVLRAFAPRLRDGGRLIVVASALGSLSCLAPVLHSRFDDLAPLDDVDRAVADWRDAVRYGSAFSGPWPAFVNIPSKIGHLL